MIQLESLSGPERAQVLPDLARLRIQVFREWPYLYDGTLEYENRYLKKFSAAENALVVVARDGEQIVGVSTASPLAGHADEFAAPFARLGYDPQRLYYFGESVLLPEFRGRGIGKQFLEHRERHARTLGAYDCIIFCAVVRSPEDARRPAEYRPLDGLWRTYGFEIMEGMTTELSWKEPDHPGERRHEMQFWKKKL